MAANAAKTFEQTSIDTAHGSKQHQNTRAQEKVKKRKRNLIYIFFFFFVK
jgi:hypothetical protein